MRLGDDIPVNVEAISTGSLSLDLALGIGGVPRGRIVEIYGPESSGKTTLALHILASAQKTGGEVAFIDVEHALEPAYARALGVDIDSLLISQPDTGEQALEITEQLVRSGALDVVVVDSVAALLPRSELEGEMGESSVGVIARLRIDVRRIETLKVGGEMIGNRTRAKIVKNKVAPPFKEAEFDIIYGEGISKIGEIVDLGVKLDLIDKAGAWYTYGDVRVQGRDSMKEFLREHPDVSDQIGGEMIGDTRSELGPVQDIIYGDLIGESWISASSRPHLRRVCARAGPRQHEGISARAPRRLGQDRGGDPRQRPQAHEPAGAQGRHRLRPRRRGGSR